MAQQKFVLKINRKYKKEEREAIAQDVIDFIVERTREKNRDKNGQLLKKYSKKYTQSLDYKIAKGKKTKVDLTLTGEMLDSIKLLSERAGSLTIGFDASDKELNGKAEGNIKGTYGNKKPVGPKRDFLGISGNALRKEVLTNYKLTNDRDRRFNVLKNLVGKEISEKFKDDQEYDLSDIEERIKEARSE